MSEALGLDIDASIANVPSRVADEANELLAVLRRKRDRNDDRLKLYEGKFDFDHLGISTPPTMDDLDVVLGWPAKAVDMVSDLCVPQGFNLPGAEIPVVDRVWEQNDLQMQLMSAVHMSLISSVAWLMTTRGVEGEPDVVWQVKDALNGTGRWNNATRRLDSFLSVTERDHGNPAEVVLYLPGYRYTLRVDRSQWRLVESVASTITDRVPVERFVFRPDDWRPFGRSRITREVEYLTGAAVRTLLRSEVSAEFYSFPQRWAMGADASDFQDENGFSLGRWRTLMGGMLAIGRDDEGHVPEVGEFRPASQQPHLEQIAVLAQAFAGETSIPVASLGVGMQQANPTSADAYMVGRADLIRLATRSMRVWGQSAKRAMMTSQELLGADMGESAWSMQLDWEDPRSVPTNTAADNLSKVTAAMPWVAETPEAIDMLNLDFTTTQNLKESQRKDRGRSLLRRIVDEA